MSKMQERYEDGTTQTSKLHIRSAENYQNIGTIKSRSLKQHGKNHNTKLRQNRTKLIAGIIVRVATINFWGGKEFKDFSRTFITSNYKTFQDLLYSVFKNFPGAGKMDTFFKDFEGSAFSALTMLVGCQEEHPVCKN